MSITKTGSYSILKLAHDAIELDLSDVIDVQQIQHFEFDLAETITSDWKRFVTYFPLLNASQRSSLLHHMTDIKIDYDKLNWIIRFNINDIDIEVRDLVIRLIENKIDAFPQLETFLTAFISTEKVLWLNDYAQKILEESWTLKAKS